MSEKTDIERVVDFALGHACTMVCRFCASGVPISCENRRRGQWFHADVTGNPLGHRCGASAIRAADSAEVARIVTNQLTNPQYTDGEKEVSGADSSC